MSGDLKVAVELRADTAQFTAQMQSAAQAQAAFAAQAQSSGTAVASALQSTNTAAQALGGGARAASQAAQALGSASQTASDALAGQAIALMRTVNNLRGVTGSLSAGVIPRLRQLAPLVTGAGLAISGAVGAVALLAKAYINGAREAQAYTQAIVMSGNAAGTTVSQLAGMAHAISQTAGTQGAAAAALAQMAGSGRVAGENLQAFTQVALGLERTVGAPVQQTVGHLSELAKAPLEASVKLNEQYHYLTASVYEQIKALEQQGRTEEAAALAQRTYISEMGRRKDEIVAHLGALERAWNSITGVAKQAWDAMLGIGRAKTPMQQLQEVQQQIAKAAPYNAELAQNAGRGGLAGWLNSREKERSDAQLQALLKQQAALIKTTTLEAQGAAAQAESARLAEAKARWDQEGAQYKSRAVKRDEEIRKAEVEGAALIAKGLETERGLRERIAAIREKYKDPKTAATGATNPEAGALRQDQDYLTRLKAEYEQLLANGGEIEKYTAKQGELVLVKDRLAKGLDSQGKALTAQTRQYLEQRQAVLEETVAQEQSKKAIEDANAARQRAKQAADNWLESMRLGNTDLQIQIDNHGKDKTAIEQSTLARMQEALATGQQIKLGGQLVAVTQDMIGAEQERIDKMQALNAQAWGDTLDKQIAAAREQLVLDQQSIALTGVSSEQRAKIVALKKVELEYTRQINKLTDDLKNKKITQAAYDDTVRKLNETRDIEAAAAVSKAYTEEVTKAADQINQGLTDAFMGAFDSGKSFAKNFRDTLKGMFNNLVLRPVISMIVQPVGGLLSGVVGSFLGGGGSSGGAGGIGNLLGLGNNASSIYTMASGTGGLVNSIGSLAGNFGYGGEFAGLASDLGFYGGSYQEALNASIGLAADATPAAGSAAATLSSVGSALGGAAIGYVGGSLISNGYSAIGNDSNTAVVAGTAIGAVVGSIFPVIGTAIGAAVGGLIGGVVNAAFGHKLADSGVEGDFGGQTGFEGQSYQFYKGGWFASNKTKHGELDPAVQQGLADQFNAMRAGAAGMAGVLGIGTEAIEGFTAHIKVSLKGLSDEEAQNALNAEFDKIAESLAATTLGTDAYTRANETALQALTRLSSGLVTVNTAFDTLGLSLMQSSLAGGDLASRLIDSFGSSDDFNNAVNDYWQNFYGEAERTATITRQLTGQMAALGLEMPATREGFRALVEAQDLTTESGVATLAALIKLESAFAQVTPSADDLAQAALDAAGALDEAMNSLRGSVGLTQDSIAGLFKSVLQDAKSAQEARALGEQKAGELFVSAVTDAMLGSVTSAVMSALVDPLVVQITAGAAQAAAIDVASAAQSASIDVAGAAASAETLVAGGAASATAVAAGGGVAAGSLAEGGAVAANNLAAGSGAAAQGLAAVVNQVVSTINSISAVMGTDEFRVAFQGFTSGIGAISGALYSGVGQINRAVGYVPPAQATAISGNSKSAADAATNRWQDAYDILTAAADVQRQVAQEQLNNAQAVLDMARKAAGDLRGLSDASVQQSAVGANQFIIDALATLRDSGYLPDPRQLSDAIDAARAGLNATGYASALDQQRQSLVLAGKLSQIADLSEPQVDAAQQQLDYLDDIAKTAKGQLDALQGSAKATMTLAQAIANWTGATGKNLPVPAFATGGRHDGGAFIAGEYGRELVVTGPARIWNATQTQAMLGGGWAEVAALLSTLITDHRAQARALADDRRFLRQLLGRWEHDGLPEQREMPEVLA